MIFLIIYLQFLYLSYPLSYQIVFKKNCFKRKKEKKTFGQCEKINAWRINIL